MAGLIAYGTAGIVSAGRTQMGTWQKRSRLDRLAALGQVSRSVPVTCAVSCDLSATAIEFEAGQLSPACHPGLRHPRGAARSLGDRLRSAQGRGRGGMPRARRAAWVRSAAWSLSRMRETWGGSVSKYTALRVGPGRGAATTGETKHGPRVAMVACPGDRRYEGNRTADRGHASRRQPAPSGVMEFLARIEQLTTMRSRPADPGDGVPRTYPLRQLGLRADARRAAGEHPVLTGRSPTAAPALASGTGSGRPNEAPEDGQQPRRHSEDLPEETERRC